MFICRQKIMMIMMNCFCGMIDQGKVCSLLRPLPEILTITFLMPQNMPRAGFEPVQNLSSGLVEWSCAVVIATTSPSFPFSWDIKKILQTYCFGYFGHATLRKPKVILSTCGKLLCSSAGKKSTSPSSFLEILQRYADLFWVL